MTVIDPSANDVLVAVIGTAAFGVSLVAVSKPFLVKPVVDGRCG